ncbi:hypothetical protein FGF1_13980 [Flavobacteriaceae bacterium GF1]
MSLLAQQSKYTQAYIDTFRMGQITPNKLKEFKKALENNDRLKGWSKYYCHKAYYFFSTENNRDSALYFANKAVTFNREHSEMGPYQINELIKPYFILGWYSRLSGNHKEALQYNIKGLKYAIQGSELYKKKSTYEPYFRRDIADSYYKIGYLNFAKKYYTSVLDDDWFMAREGWRVYHNLGMINFFNNKLDSSLYHFKNGLLLVEDKFKSDEFYEEYKSWMYGNIGTVYREMGNNDSTLHYYNLVKTIRTFKSYHRIPNRYKISEAFRQTYALYSDIPLDPNGVLLELQKINDSIDQMDIPLDDRAYLYLMTTIHDMKLEAYQTKGDYKKAFDVALQKNLLEKQIHRKVLTENLGELEAKFQLENKEAEISKLALSNTNKELRLSQQRITTYGIVGFVMVLGGITFLLIRQKNMKTRYYQTHLEQRLLRSQLHPHFIFNSLNSIYNQFLKTPEKAKPYLLGFSSLLRIVLENSLQELASFKKEIEAIQYYMNLESKFSKEFSYSIEYKDFTDLDAVLIPPMLLQPLIENAIKHGFDYGKKNELKLFFEMKFGEQLIRCTINDNGRGISNRDGAQNKTPRKASLSVSNDIIRKRLQIYSKTLKTKSKVSIEENEGGKGTTVELWIPFKSNLA